MAPTKRSGYAKVEGSDHEPTHLYSSQSADPRFSMPPGMEERAPVKAILLAVGLLVFGVMLITGGAMMLHGHFSGNSGWGFVTLGVLVFLPGFYETRIAYYTWRGYSEYKYSQIPAM